MQSSVKPPVLAGHDGRHVLRDSRFFQKVIRKARLRLQAGLLFPAPCRERGVAAFEAAIRFASAPIIRCCAAVGGSSALRMRYTPCGCRSAHLVGVQPNFRLPPVSTMRRASAMPHSVGSLPPSKRHSRLTIVRRGCCQVAIRRNSWRSHVHRTHTAQRVQPFKLQTRNGGVKGRRPLRSLGGPRGIFSHVREYPPYPQPHTVREKAAASSGCSPSAPCAEKERTSLSRSPLFLLIFCCTEAIIPLPASPSRQRQPSPVRRRNTARIARSASRTSRGTGSWSAGQWRSSSALPRGTRPR